MSSVSIVPSTARTIGSVRSSTASSDPLTCESTMRIRLRRCQGSTRRPEGRSTLKHRRDWVATEIERVRAALGREAPAQFLGATRPQQLRARRRKTRGCLREVFVEDDTVPRSPEWSERHDRERFRERSRIPAMRPAHACEPALGAVMESNAPAATGQRTRRDDSLVYCALATRTTQR